MKKRIVLFLAICMSVMNFTACSKSPEPVADSQIPSVSSYSETVSQTDEIQESSQMSETTQHESSNNNSNTVSQQSSQNGNSSDVSVFASLGSQSDTQTQSSNTAGSFVTSQSETSRQTSKTESTAQPQNSSTASTVPPVSRVQESKTESKTEPKTESRTEPKSESKPDQTVTSAVSTPESSVKPQTSQPQTSQTQTSQIQQTSQSETSKTETKTDNNYDIGGISLYNALFNIENRVTVDISMSKSEIDKLQSDYNKYTGSDENKKSPIYRMATVTFTVGSQKYTVEEVGIRLKGNQSIRPFYSSNGKPNLCSFKLSFDETFDDKSEYGTSAKVWTDDNARKARKKRKFATLNELDIKWNISYDNTNIREVYATKLFESADVLVQKIGLSQMNVNGNNYGLVKIYEPVDKTFLEKRLPESAIGGDLYKCMWSECNNSGNRTGNWRGATYKTDNSYGVQDNANGKKYNFNLKTNKSTSKHAQLRNFLNVINKSNITREELENVLDVDYYANFMAASYFAGDPDDIRNNYNNHYIYFRKDNGKAIFIVYDNDRTLGITYGLNRNCAERNPYSSYAATQGQQENPLIQKTISHNPLSSLSYVRDKYSESLRKLSQTEMLTSDADFNKMYNTAKRNYESIITPYTYFDNQRETFRFSLDGNRNGGDYENMSFEQFRSQIMNTYQTAKP